MKEVSIWREGYSLTGDYSPAEFMGKVVVEDETDFKACCHKLLKNDKHYNKKANTWWGCRLFDNQAEAAESFG